MDNFYCVNQPGLLILIELISFFYFIYIYQYFDNNRSFIINRVDLF